MLLFSRLVVSHSLWPHERQHSRFLCLPLSPRVCSNLCPELMMLSNHLILCCPLLFLPSIFPSIRVISNESALHIRCEDKMLPYLKGSTFLCIHGYSVCTKWLLFLVSYERKGNAGNKKDLVILETQSRSVICWSWIWQRCYGVGEAELGVALAAVYWALLLCTRHFTGCFTCLISDPPNSFVISRFLQRRKLDKVTVYPTQSLFLEVGAHMLKK